MILLFAALAAFGPIRVEAAIVERETDGVRPHVFSNGMTLLDLAGEGLHPWGLYGGGKIRIGMAFMEAANTGENDEERGRANTAAGPCYWGHSGFGAPAHRNRCGHPAGFPGVTAPPGIAFLGGGGGGGGGGTRSPAPTAGVTPIPLPPAGLLLLGGIALLALRSRRGKGSGRSPHQRKIPPPRPC